jgi:hypothetical protein
MHPYLTVFAHHPRSIRRETNVVLKHFNKAPYVLYAFPRVHSLPLLMPIFEDHKKSGAIFFEFYAPLVK